MQGRLESKEKMYKLIDKKLDGKPKYLTVWINNLKAAGKSPKTINDYLGKVLGFLGTINTDMSQVDIKDISVDDLDTYFIKIQTKIVNGQTVETTKSFCQASWYALNSFFSCMEKRKYIAENIMTSIDKVKGEDDPDSEKARQNLLTKDDFKKMLEYDNIPGENHHFKIRNKSILLLLMITGMRRNALCEINVEDVTLQNMTLAAVDKGGKPFMYHLTADAVIELKRWLMIRDRYLHGKTTDALFISRYGTRINGNVVRDIVNDNSYMALGKVVNPHKIRAGLCSILYEETHDIEFVRRVIGHKASKTTQRYITTGMDERQVSTGIMSDLLA